MAYAAGNNSSVSYIAESVYGTTPATPAMTVIPVTSFGLNMTREMLESNAIQANRQRTEPRNGNNNITGPLAVEMQHGTYDALFESLFRSTWNTNVLKVGNTEKSFTFERGHSDVTQYQQFRGVQVNNANIEVSTSGFVTCSFGLLGKNGTLTQTSIADSSSSASGSPYVHFDGSFTEGGAGTNVLTSLSINMDNGLSQNYRLGSRDLSNMSPGLLSVTGTLSAYFEDETLADKFIDETVSSISFTLTDSSANALTITIPKLRYSGAEISVSGTETIIMSMPFSAWYDSVTQTTIQLTRSA